MIKKEHVGCMLPQIGLDGEAITKNEYITEFCDNIDNLYCNDGPIDFISDDTLGLLKMIENNKIKLFAVRLSDISKENYLKEFDITRNLVSLIKKLNSVIKTSSTSTLIQIRNYQVQLKYKRKDILNRLILDFFRKTDRIGVVSNYSLLLKKLNNLKDNIELVNNSDIVKENLPIRFKNIYSLNIDNYRHIINLVSRDVSPVINIDIVEEDNVNKTINILACNILYRSGEIKSSEVLPTYKLVLPIYDDIINKAGNLPDPISIDSYRDPDNNEFFIYITLRLQFNGNELEYDEDDDDYIESVIVKEEMSSELKQADVQRGEVADIARKIELAKIQFNKTGERKYENMINGLEYKLNKAKSKVDNIEDKLDNYNEAVEIEDEIKPIVNKLNEKGYTVRYASPGHHIKKKEDNDKDGKYYGKLYSDARIMFDNNYNLGEAPEYWHFRIVDGCSYLDITPKDTNSKTEDDLSSDFFNWKKSYMNTLEKWADELEDNKNVRSESKKDEFSESMEDGMDLDYSYNVLLESFNDI